MANFTSPLSDATLGLPVKNLIKRAPLFVQAGATVAEAAQAMQAARVGSVLIAGEPPGIITDRDLRGRVLAARLGTETSVSEVMTRPVITINASAPALAALRLMIEENIHHLPVTEEGKIVGVVSATDLLIHQGKNPLYLRSVIETLDDSERLGNYAEEIGQLANSLFHSGLAALQISQILSSLNDALVKRLVTLAIAKLGAAPTQFAWIVFGSEGRLEQALLTDQDNGLIYRDGSDAARTYFAALAQQVVDGLIQVGFPRCPGGYMATNWCKPLAEWQSLFSRWVSLPEPQALLDAAIFFDFRAVAGDLPLTTLDELIVLAKNEKRFLAQLAKDALGFHPPLGFFNRLQSEHGKVDLKKGGIAPIVALARVAALAAGSRQRSTLERLAVAAASGAVINRESARLLAEIFSALLQLRLREQLINHRANRPIDNRVLLTELSPLERGHLKEAFGVIKQIQDELRATWQLDRLA